MATAIFLVFQELGENVAERFPPWEALARRDRPAEWRFPLAAIDRRGKAKRPFRPLIEKVARYDPPSFVI